MLLSTAASPELLFCVTLLNKHMKVSCTGETHPQFQPTVLCTGTCHRCAQALLEQHSTTMGPHVPPAGLRLVCVPHPRGQEQSRAPGGDIYNSLMFKAGMHFKLLQKQDTSKELCSSCVSNPPLTWLLNCSKFSKLLIHQKVRQANDSTSNAYINYSYSIII